MQGGGKHPPARGSALRGDAGRAPRAGVGTAARPGPVLWEAGLGRARGSRAAESAGFGERGSCGEAWEEVGEGLGSGRWAGPWERRRPSGRGGVCLPSPRGQQLAKPARLGVPG